MNAMAMYYDLKVSYKNDIIFNFMDLNEIFIKIGTKKWKIKLVILQNYVYLGNQKP